MALGRFAPSGKMNKFDIQSIFRESKQFSLKNVWIASVVIMFIQLEDFNIKIMNAKQKFVVNQWTIWVANVESRHAHPTHTAPTQH